MQSDFEIESNMLYQLKINDMILVQNEKQTLIDCIASILGLEGGKVHQIICDHLTKYVKQYNHQSLPRKLSYILKDPSLIEDYRKYPKLVNFMKITLQMVSQIFEVKITIFYLNNQGLLTGLIVNQKGYQSQIKIAKINNNDFMEIKDNYHSNSDYSPQKLDGSNSSHSFNKFYEVFEIEPISKKPSINFPETNLAKSYSQMPGSPLLRKNNSLFDQRTKNKTDQQNKSGNISTPIPVPILVSAPQVVPQFELENIVEDTQLHSAQQFAENIKLNQQQTSPQRVNTQPTPIITPTIPSTVKPEEQSVIYQQDQQTQNGLYYPYYTQPIYYPQYLMANGRRQNYNNNYGNISNASMSPGKNQIRRQNSSLEINENERYTGRLKFFDEGKNFGFIIMDADESDIFVHCDDLQKAGINKERVRSYKQSEGLLRFSFKVMSYFGKYKESRKAVDLIILDDGLGMPSLYT